MKKNIIFVLLILLAGADEIKDAYDYLTQQAADPMPTAYLGLGCITDSECEGIERVADNLPLSVRE